MAIMQKMDDYSQDVRHIRLERAPYKRLQNCAYCNEYACEKLKKFFVNDPDTKARLDMIRRILKS
jgi:hypothetical protein